MFDVLLVTASVVVTFVSDEWVRPSRMVGGGVRMWSGFVLIGVGVWFLVLSMIASPIIV